MTSCPTCNKPVDPLRARAVIVRDGKVVAYCSKECAGQAEPSKPTLARVPPLTGITPATGTPKRAARDYDSGPVIEIVHEPVSGVVTSAPDRRDSRPVIAATTPERAEGDAKSIDPTPPPAPGKKADATPLPAPGKKVDATPLPTTKGKDEIPRASASITTEIDPREILGPDDDDEAEGEGEDTGGRRRAGPSTIRRRRDSMESKLADDWLDDEPADVRPETLTEGEPRRGRGVLIAVLLLIIVGGGGLLYYQMVYLPGQKPARGSGERVPAQPPAVGTVVPGSVEAMPPAAPPPQPTAKAALARAQSVLREYITAETPRVSRFAAVALSRSGDTLAVDRLKTALDKDKLEDAQKLDIAYALARAGDKRGLDLLVTALGASRRDDRLAAARGLAQLGDNRAVAMLATFLELDQHRRGAAHELARFADARAIKLLEQMRADDKTPADDRKMATIALAIAGRTEVTADLKKLLEDRFFNLYAAEALASLHDELARPVLVQQLSVRDIRVRAARSLRRLAPEHDTSPYLEKLVAMLDDPAMQKDTERIPTAEAILLLAGPASWSERM
jgi:HEAT repeat protein